MTEPPTEPPTEPSTELPAEPTAEPPAAPATPRVTRLRWFPWATGAGFLILAAGLIWVWQHPVVQPPHAAGADALAHQLAELEDRVSRLEQRPQPQFPDIGPLTGRIAALEQRPTSTAPVVMPAPDLGPLERRITALEQRQQPNLAPLDARIATLEARQATDNQLGARVVALESVVGSEQSRLSADSAITRRVQLAQAATLALASGRKLGDLPGAPPALAQFASSDPPTLSGLRLSFPQAMREALVASQPAAEGKPLLARLWAQAQELVTVRQGDHVLIGDPASGVLQRARVLLDAGDLAGAATEVAALQGPAARAMAGWLAQARALLAARAALAAWVASG